MSVCPVCAEPSIRARGLPDSAILIVGEWPGPVEVEKGRPFCGQSGMVLRTELAKLGIDMAQLRITNLWIHPPTKNENCFKVGHDLVLDEAKGKKAILLVGSEVVDTFTEYNVSDICGLPLDSNDHPFSCDTVMAIPNPASAFHRNVGEIRFGLTSFVKLLKERGIIDER